MTEPTDETDVTTGTDDRSYTTIEGRVITVVDGNTRSLTPKGSQFEVEGDFFDIIVAVDELLAPRPGA